MVGQNQPALRRVVRLYDVAYHDSETGRETTEQYTREQLLGALIQAVRYMAVGDAITINRTE